MVARPSNTHALAVLLAVAVPAGCGSCDGCSDDKPNPALGQGVDSIQAAIVAQKDAPDGLNMRLREGSLAGRAGARNKLAKASKLSPDKTKQLLSRLPAFEVQAGDEKTFALRESSQPPPRTGETVKTPFPPPVTAPRPETADAAALELLRYSPQGEVPLAPHLSVTFSKPMVAVTSHGDAAASVPVKLSPQPKGQWRWVGTRTVLFDPEVRFPQATEYTVSIASDTKALDGKALGQQKSWTFATPPVTLKAAYPRRGPTKLSPLIFLSFDQKIDPKQLIEHVYIKHGDTHVPLRLATKEEIAADVTVKSMTELAEKDEQQGRYVALKPASPLPIDTTVSIVVPQGTPSAEGPRVTPSDQYEFFKTYGPLTITEARCGWGSQCPPQSGWRIEMSNPLDPEEFDPSAFKIEPELPGRAISVSGHNIYIRGLAKGRTKYTVTVPASLTDTFGQKFGKDETRDFHVGPARPQLSGPGGLVVLDPYAKGAKLNVFSINQQSLDVQIYKVEPSDWDAFSHYMYRWRDKSPPPIPGRRVFSGKVETTKGDDELVETAIDLSKAFDEGLGHAIVIVEPTEWENQHYRPRVQTWVQATRLGLDAFVDNDRLLAWTTELKDGKPAKGVSLSISPTGVSGTSDENGTASLALPSTHVKGRHLLLAKRGKDVAFLPEQLSWWNDYGGWYKRSAGTSLRWMVFDDRGMYKPGEEVHAKGWIRQIDNGVGGDIAGLAGSVASVDYVVKGSRGNEITKGSAPVNAIGGFDFKFSLPTTPNLGRAQIRLTARGQFGGSYSHAFQIQEFRRPEYEVTTEVSPGPFTIGTTASITASARYYSGGGLPAAPVQWTVTSSSAGFRPPGHDRYTFGTWIPWWRQDHNPQGSTSKSFSGTTTTDGKHVLDIDFLSVKPPRAMSVVATARVTDVNRQAWASNATLVVHPSELYVGVRRDEYFVERGKPIKFEMLVVDQEGKTRANVPIQAKIVRLDWKWKNGRYDEVEKDEQSCNKISSNSPTKCSLPTTVGGTYKVTTSVVDERGRPNETSIRVWVTGGKSPPARNVEQEKVTLIPDRETYSPGDTAKLLVQAPFTEAEGILTIRRSGIVRSSRFVFKGTTHVLEVPIGEGDTPNLFVQVDVVGKTQRLGADGQGTDRLPPRPAFGTGSINLPIPAQHRTLSVAVTPKQGKLEPGGKTTVDLVVSDQSGKPVSNAEVAVVVVDESVLALSGYATPDPIKVFYTQRGAGVRDFHSRGYVKLARPDADELTPDEAPGDAPAPPPAPARMAEEESMADDEGYGGGTGTKMALSEGRMGSKLSSRSTGQYAMKKNGADPVLAREQAVDAARSAGILGVLKDKEAPMPDTPIVVRSNFNALATFVPDAKTDARGRIAVPVELPDNLTRYRVMAVAVDPDKQFGAGESSITARMPLMVRPSPPRFLNFGDAFEMPIVVQNQTDAPIKVSVAMRSANAELTDGAGRELSVPANDRLEVRFPARAALPGTARFQVGIAAGKWADAKTFELPVWTPATTEAFATYGEIDRQGAMTQAVAKPSNVVDEFGGLEVSTSSTQLQALTDAVLYLVRYPYECSEQLSSRILAVAGLRDVLAAFEADGLPSSAAIATSMKKDIERLRNIQSSVGGFGFWTHRDRDWPYLSVHVAHALARAKQKGYAVPEHMLRRSKTYLQRIEQHIPSFYPREVGWTIIAYSLYVRKLLGDVDAAKARQLVATATVEKLPMEAVGFVLYTLAKAPGSAAVVASLHKHLNNRATETAGGASFASAMSDGAHLILHSNRRVDAIILEALLESKPSHDLIPKLVRSLLAHRTRGKWRNTQENVFVLLAMDRYFEVFERVTPNFVARAWLGDKYAGEHAFRGRTTERHRIDIPMNALGSSAQDLILQRDGRGRMYYRIGMRYAPSNLRLDPADHGFAVERIYEAVDDPGDVKRNKNGSWEIKAGARIRVRLTMVAESRRHHVALVDPLPAGLEPLNPALKVTGSLPADPQAQSGYWWWSRTWYEHQNMRDERVEAFTSTLWPGVHNYSYMTTATTPGIFVVPPAKAEEMYAPETFGRSASDKVIVR